MLVFSPTLEFCGSTRFQLVSAAVPLCGTTSTRWDDGSVMVMSWSGQTRGQQPDFGHDLTILQVYRGDPHRSHVISLLLTEGGTHRQALLLAAIRPHPCTLADALQLCCSNALVP
jgi:hypothetical protein